MVGGKCLLISSPLPLAPLAVAGFLVADLVAWQYFDRFAGCLDFRCSGFCFARSLCWNVGWFAGFKRLVPMPFLAFVAASQQPSTIGALLQTFIVFALPNFPAEMSAG